MASQPLPSGQSPTWILLDSSGTGGIETHVFHLAKALRDQRGPCKVVLMANHGPLPLTAALEQEGVDFEYIRGGSLGLFNRLRQAPPRLLHTHGYKAGILGRFFARLLDLPVVSTFHAGDPGKGMLRLYTLLDEATAGLGIALAVSPQIQQRLWARSDLIDNFVPLPGRQKPPSQQTPPAGARCRVAFVGRLSYEKGPDRFCHLAQHCPDTDFVLFGDGPLRQELQISAAPNVTFQGQVTDMESHWHGIDLLCMPSRQEGLPLAALEAMAHQTPVLAFNVGALSQLIHTGHNGWLSPAGDLPDMSRRLQQWLATDKQARARLANNAYDSIARRYSTQAVLPSILAAYDKAQTLKSPRKTLSRRMAS